MTDSPLRLVPSSSPTTITDRAGHPPTPPPTLLPPDPAADALEADDAERGAGTETGRPGRELLLTLAAADPSSTAVWAALAEEHLEAGRLIDAYAAARTGYHRGLDQLRRSGWRGAGPVPWSHVPNRGWLRCVAALGRAADGIGETDEAERCGELLRASDPAAAAALGLA